MASLAAYKTVWFMASKIQNRCSLIIYYTYFIRVHPIAILIICTYRRRVSLESETEISRNREVIERCVCVCVCTCIFSLCSYIRVLGVLPTENEDNEDVQELFRLEEVEERDEDTKNDSEIGRHNLGITDSTSALPSDRN